MKISSMDAANFTPSIQRQDTSNIVQSKNPAVPAVTGPSTGTDNQQLPDKYLPEAIAKANRIIAGSNRKFEISIHEKTKAIVVKVVDTDTNEVVREFPPEKILDLVANLMQLAGLVVDERR